MGQRPRIWNEVAMRSDSDPAVYMTAREVSALLRVKLQTVYAYVSRGWIRRVRSQQHRHFLYLREDVERLDSRQRGRSEKGILKGSAPHWSPPVVQTSITDLTPEGPCYRGRNAIDLARRHHRFENVAEMIWTGVWHDDPLAWEPAQLTPAQERLFTAMLPPDSSSPATIDVLQYFSALVLSLAVGPQACDDLRDGTTVACARSVFRLMAGSLGALRPGGRSPLAARSGQSIAAQVAAGLGLPTHNEIEETINIILVLLADHQLTPPAVACRLAASSGASLFHCLNSALSVHSSSRVRRHCDRVETLLLETADSAQFCQRLDALRRLGMHAATLESPLYPDGDPRADLMLELAERHVQTSPRRRRLAGHIAQMRTTEDLRPSVETGLVLLCHALGMPQFSAAALLTVSRCAGWIGHIIEQRTAGLMLRPRIRYRG